jgi:PAS domain S-box-containing protein
MSDTSPRAPQPPVPDGPVTTFHEVTPTRMMELIEQSLTGADPEHILHRATEIAGALTQSAYTAYMEVRVGEPGFVLRAGCGWSEGLLGSIVDDPELDSLSRLTLAERKSVEVRNPSSAGAGRDAMLLQRTGIVCGCSVPVEIDGRALGVLCVYADTMRAYSAEEKAALAMIASIIAGTTERFRDLHALQLLQQAVDAASMPMFLLDAEMAIRYANSAMCGYTGFPSETLTNMTLPLLLADDGAGDWLDRLYGATSGATVSFTGRLKRRDGFVVSATVTADKFPYEGMMHAVVRMRPAEQPAEGAETTSPVASDAAHQPSAERGILILDGDGTILHHDTAALSLFSIPRGEHVGQKLQTVFSEDFSRALLQEVSLALRQQRPGILEHEAMVDGAPVWYRTRIDPIRARDGSPPTVVVTTQVAPLQREFERNMVSAAARNLTMDIPDRSPDRPAKQDAGVPVVLLVEDDPSTITYMTQLLKSQYRVVAARCAADMWDELQRNSIAVILMDIALRGNTDGLQLTRQIRESGAYAAIPVIAVTAFASAQDRQRCLAAGCNAYYTKPINTKMFLQTLMELALRPLQDAR